MDLSPELVEALDRVADTWEKPVTEDSVPTASEAAAGLLDQLHSEHPDVDRAEGMRILSEVVHDCANRAGYEEEPVWFRRAAAAGSVLQAWVQMLAAESSQNN